MGREWFKPWGWVYRPSSWQAVALSVVVVGLGVQLVAVSCSRSQSAGDLLLCAFPAVMACLVLLNWVASKTSPASRRPPRRRLRDMDSPGWDV